MQLLQRADSLQLKLKVLLDLSICINLALLRMERNSIGTSNEWAVLFIFAPLQSMGRAFFIVLLYSCPYSCVEQQRNVFQKCYEQSICMALAGQVPAGVLIDGTATGTGTAFLHIGTAGRTPRASAVA